MAEIGGKLRPATYVESAGAVEGAKDGSGAGCAAGGLAVSGCKADLQ